MNGRVTVEAHVDGTRTEYTEVEATEVALLVLLRQLSPPRRSDPVDAARKAL